MSFSGARVYAAAQQNVSSLTVLAFGSTRYDTGGYVSGTTALVAPATAYYRVGACVYAWSYGDDWTVKELWIRVNGGTSYPGTEWQGEVYASMTNATTVLVDVRLSLGDYIEAVAWVDPNTTGSGHSPKGYQSCSAEMWMSMIG